VVSLLETGSMLGRQVSYRHDVRDLTVL